MPRTKKLSAFAIQAQWKRAAERDARAFEIAKRTGVSFQEAWLLVEPRESTGVDSLKVR